MGVCHPTIDTRDVCLFLPFHRTMRKYGIKGPAPLDRMVLVLMRRQIGYSYQHPVRDKMIRRMEQSDWTWPSQDVVPRTEVMSSHFALNIRLFSVGWRRELIGWRSTGGSRSVSFLWRPLGRYYIIWPLAVSLASIGFQGIFSVMWRWDLRMRN